MNVSKKVNLEYSKDTENLYETEPILTYVCQFGIIRRKNFSFGTHFYRSHSNRLSSIYLSDKEAPHLSWSEIN